MGDFLFSLSHVCRSGLNKKYTHVNLTGENVAAKFVKEELLSLICPSELNHDKQLNF